MSSTLAPAGRHGLLRCCQGAETMEMRSLRCVPRRTLCHQRQLALYRLACQQLVRNHQSVIGLYGQQRQSRKQLQKFTLQMLEHLQPQGAHGHVWCHVTHDLDGAFQPRATFKSSLKTQGCYLCTAINLGRPETSARQSDQLAGSHPR